jgi:hypothetical protein
MQNVQTLPKHPGRPDEISLARACSHATTTRMTHKEIPFPGFRVLRCLKHPGRLLENVPCYSLVLDSGTFLFPMAWAERSATISAVRLHYAVSWG